MIRPGQEWGKPASGPADFELTGTDADLASWVAAHPGASVAFTPEPISDLGLAVGLVPDQPPKTELPMDVLRISMAETPILAVNMIVVGRHPHHLSRFSRGANFSVTVDGREMFTGPATTVVVATGQFLDGLDLVPRGHPGDGRAEVQVYALAPGARAGMRKRIAAGAHLPHPDIHTRTGRHVTIRANRWVRTEHDGTVDTCAEATIEVVEGAYRLLV